MYQEIVRQTKKAEQIRCFAVVPVCIFFAVVSIFFFRDSAGIGSVLRWALPVALLCLAAGTVISYLRLDKKLAEMKKAAEARSDADMDALLAQSTGFDNTYFISELYVLNFTTQTAYPRSLITKIEPYEHNSTDSDGNVTGTDYCLRIRFGDRGKDTMKFITKAKRDAAYAALVS